MFEVQKRFCNTLDAYQDVDIEEHDCDLPLDGRKANMHLTFVLLASDA